MLSRKRLTRTIETVAILRQAWTGERFSHRGEVFELDRVRVTPPPAQPGGPPILLGGYVDAALRRQVRELDMDEVRKELAEHTHGPGCDHDH